MESESRLSLTLRRGENIGLFVCVVGLVLVEAGYIAWLERLPEIPRQHQPIGFVGLPPWYEHPRAEITLLLTILGGLIPCSEWRMFVFLRAGGKTPAALERRAGVVHFLKTAGVFALLTGADILLVQLFQS
jgi:uncharacterized iron-regulated membrane protein